jgi:2-(1,2-epoxy-1,2-dihydrophenyl)acetyl-CoA isomerase
MAHVRVEPDGDVLRVVLDRADRRNALDLASMDAVTDAVLSAGDARVVVITGAGDHFCAGADIGSADRGRADPPPRTGAVHRAVAAGAHRMLRALWELELPVVAGVQGAAAGLGCSLALGADHVVAGASARFSLPFVERGFSADSGSTWLLPRLVGLARAKQLLLLARPLTAAEALAWGLVADVVDDAELADAVDDAARRFATGPTVAIGLTRRLLHGGAGDLGAALHAEELAVELAVRSPDFKEGIAAFRERRPPRYTGR